MASEGEEPWGASCVPGGALSCNSLVAQLRRERKLRFSTLERTSMIIKYTDFKLLLTAESSV